MLWVPEELLLLLAMEQELEQHQPLSHNAKANIPCALFYKKLGGSTEPPWLRHCTAGEGFSVAEGRPVGTTAAEGYSVSSGRPVGTTAAEGYLVSSGRPVYRYHSS